MRYRQATLADVDLLAGMNRQLIQDEGHRNRMTLPELVERMRGWLAGQYTAILFEQEDGPVAYALYRRDPDSIYLRQFFVDRRHRRQGIGLQAMRLLLEEVWPRGSRITVEVLVKNEPAHAFWRAVGFQDYCMALEREAGDGPGLPGEGAEAGPAVQPSLEPMSPEDWPVVQAIYREGIATGNATFETDVPPWEQWDAAHRRDCRLVARLVCEVVGWAALSPASARQVYAGVAEVSVYVAEALRGRGVGRALLQALVEESERCGVWTLQAGILAENEASLALHRACGFREVGRRERLGRLHGAWRDVILVERRRG